MTTDQSPIQTWARRGIGTGIATYQYALLVVFIGVITTVAAGDTDPATADAPLIVRFIDVPFISRALAAELGGYGLVAVMFIAVITFLAYTGLALPMLHGAAIPVTAVDSEYVVTLPDVTVAGIAIDPLLAAVPGIVIVVSTALPILDQDADPAIVSLLKTGGVTGLSYATTILVVAVLAREILFAFLTVIGGAAATTGVTVHLLTPGTVTIVAGYAVVLATVGTGVGYLVRDIDIPRDTIP